MKLAKMSKKYNICQLDLFDWDHRQRHRIAPSRAARLLRNKTGMSQPMANLVAALSGLGGFNE